MLFEAQLEDVRNDFRLVISAGGEAPAVLPSNVVSVRAADRSLRFVVSRDADNFIAGLKQGGATIVQVAPLSLREIFLETIRKEEEPCSSGNAGGTLVSASSAI